MQYLDKMIDWAAAVSLGLCVSATAALAIYALALWTAGPRMDSQPVEVLAKYHGTGGVVVTKIRIDGREFYLSPNAGITPCGQ